MSKLDNKHIFLSYWDIYGHGINKNYISSYKDSVIFDSYNRSFYTEGKHYGNHEYGTYHGEIFNDFVHNHAYGDYSSAHGYNVVSYNPWEFSVGHYNNSKENETLFTVGNGYEGYLSNVFEVHYDGSTYANGDMYIGHDLYTNGDLNIGKNLYISGTTYSGGDYDISGNLAVKKNMSVLGDSYLFNTAYMYNSAYVNGSLYINDLDVEAAYSYTFAYMGSYIGQTMKNAVKTIGLGQYYIWVGKTTDMPVESERYDNVLYIAVDEMPSNDKWYIDVDFDSLIFADSADGAGQWILTAEDGDELDTNDRVLRHNGIQSDIVR